ncbi:hypothetical protein J8C07_12990 [Chloracidobacterium sp. S]|nr:hypothetical protein [Chloracidobacterium aggregatum]QUV89580.1 hypothetical protein J8C07_12990 [Chloracidobacterium sp. S]
MTQIVRGEGITDPAAILERLDASLLETFRCTGTGRRRHPWKRWMVWR